MRGKEGNQGMLQVWQIKDYHPQMQRCSQQSLLLLGSLSSSALTCGRALMPSSALMKQKSQSPYCDTDALKANRLCYPVSQKCLMLDSGSPSSYTHSLAVHDLQLLFPWNPAIMKTVGSEHSDTQLNSSQKRWALQWLLLLPFSVQQKKGNKMWSRKDRYKADYSIWIAETKTWFASISSVKFYFSQNKSNCFAMSSNSTGRHMPPTTLHSESSVSEE